MTTTLIPAIILGGFMLLSVCVLAAEHTPKNRKENNE